MTFIYIWICIFWKDSVPYIYHIFSCWLMLILPVEPCDYSAAAALSSFGISVSEDPAKCKHRHCALSIQKVRPDKKWFPTLLTFILWRACAFDSWMLSSSMAAPPSVQPCSSRRSCSTNPSSWSSFFLWRSAATRSCSSFSSSSSCFASPISAASDSTGMLDGDAWRETDVWFNLFLLPLWVCIYNTAITVTEQP